MLNLAKYSELVCYYITKPAEFYSEYYAIKLWSTYDTIIEVFIEWRLHKYQAIPQDLMVCL